MATKKERAAGKAAVKFWLGKLEKAQKTLKEYKDDAEKAYDAAHDTGNLKHAFNIHWSSCAILRSAIYASRPKPDVRRRYQKPDPEEKELARLVERAIEYNLDVYEFETESNNVVRDYVEVGLGVPRLIYEVKSQPILGEDGEPIYLDEKKKDPAEEITSQCVKVEHVPWSQFLWEPGKAWKDIDWVAFKTFKSKKDIKDEYGIDLRSGKDDETKLKADDYEEMSTIWEIWHRPSKTIYVICPNYEDAPLEEYPDELSLSGFFPCPQPLMANVKYDELIPKPDYCFIEPQLKQINRLAERMHNLSAYIKDVSLYDEALSKDIANLMNQSDGAMVPVNGLAATMQALGGGNGWDGAILTAPNDRKIQVIRELMGQLNEAKEQLYEVYGISDIVRGASVASETATAQQIKAQYSNVRMNEKQGSVAMLWRNFFRMMAEVICERFDDMQLYLMTGIEVTERMREIMDNDIGRSFAIDVETDSTIMQDDQENRQQTIEMIDTLVQRLEVLIPAVLSGSLPVSFAQETLRLLASSHKHGKNLMDAIEEIGPHLEGMIQFQEQMQQLQQQLQQTMAQGEEMAQENQDLQKQLQQINERKEAREDRKVKLEEVEKASKIRDTDVDNAREAMEAEADVDKTKAETMKIIREATEPNVVGM